jgi:hypothetical protein
MLCCWLRGRKLVVNHLGLAEARAVADEIVVANGTGNRLRWFGL